LRRRWQRNTGHLRQHEPTRRAATLEIARSVQQTSAGTTEVASDIAKVNRGVCSARDVRAAHRDRVRDMSASCALRQQVRAIYSNSCFSRSLLHALYFCPSG
jgi:hypothetical protein